MGVRLDLLAGHPHGVAGRVDGQLAEGHGAVRGLGSWGMVRFSTALTRATSSRGREGLDHIVVRAAFQAGQLVVFLAAGGQDDDRRVDVAGAHLPQAGHAVHKGHHHIQDHQIKAARRSACERAADAVARFLADIACIL